ncbi:MAG: tyrosine-type recombinase/integrase [Chloroflexota bacterium]|nr:tyrosine-type recombinase/integrase [Chloroflexota bacterium]
MTTIRESIDGFLLASRAKSPATRNTYATGLNAFREYLEAVEVDPDTHEVSALPKRCLEQFYLWLVDRRGPDRLATVETYLSGLRGLLRYLAGEDAIPHISLERSREQLRRVKVRKNYLSPNVDSALSLVVQTANDTPVPEGAESRFQAIRVLRDRAILNTLYTTGMRRAEVASLNRVDLKAGRRGEAIITGKGKKQRVVFFDESALFRIEEYLSERSDGYAPLFISHPNRGKPGPRGESLRLSPQTIWLTVKRYARAAGITASTHDFRHLKATTMLGRGADLSQVQDLLGHASPETTKTIYAHYSIQELRSAFDLHSQPLSAALADLHKGTDDSQ